MICPSQGTGLDDYLRMTDKLSIRTLNPAQLDSLVFVVEPRMTAVCSLVLHTACLAVLCVCADVWSAGCVVAELLLGQPIFPGDSGVDQLVEIIKVLGTPSREQIREMNQNYQEFKFPQIKAHPWPKVSHVATHFKHCS